MIYRPFVPEPMAVTDEDWVRAGVGAWLRKASMDRIPDRLLHKAVLLRWQENVHDFLSRGAGMLFHGDARQGKTMAAVCCMGAAMRWGPAAHFLRAASVPEVLFKGAHLAAHLATVELLVLDEITSAVGKEQAAGMVENLLRRRFDAELTTILTTNGFVKDIEEKYGAPALAIITERCFPVHFTGASFHDEERGCLAALFRGGF